MNAETKPDDFKLLLTRDQAAAALTISVRQLNRLVARGELKRINLGRSAKYAKADLEKFVARKLKEA